MKNLFFVFLCLLFGSHLLFSQVAIAPSSGDGTSGSPYQIASWQNLYWISQNSSSWDKYFIQTTDIDFAVADPAIDTWESNQGWTPIGNGTTSFSGNYNGQNHSITGLYINRNSTEGIGFFGSISSATIANLNLAGTITVIANGYLYVAGLAAKSSNSSLTNIGVNCTVNGQITGVDGGGPMGEITSYSWIGGIIADMSGGTLNGCTAIVQIDADIRNSNGMMGCESTIGGIAGMINSCTFTDCSSSGEINITGDFAEYYELMLFVGGAIGRNWGSTISGSNSSCTVAGNNYTGNFGGFIGGHFQEAGVLTDSYATGTVEGYEPGGFIGWTSEATTSRCYSTGNVRGSYDGGGFAATIAYNAVVNNCYSTGNFTRITTSDRTTLGGFAGYVESCTIDKCYSTGRVIYEGTTDPIDRGFTGYAGNIILGAGSFWDTETSLQSTSSSTSFVTGKTSAEMKTQSTFTDAGWDFVGESTNGSNDYWTINSSNNNGYPYFSWQTFTTSPSAQPTDLVLSNSGTDPYNVELSFTASASADKYLVVRKTGSAPTFTPSDGTEYSTGAQGSDYVVYSGANTTATDATISENTYYYKIYAFNGSGSDTKYLTTNPLSGYTIISLDGTSSLGSTGTDPVSTGFPDAGVNITFPNGTTGTDLTVTKTASAPESNFAALPGVRGMKNLYFTITSSNATPGTYTLVLDFSSLVVSDWTKFKIMKRADATAAWKDVTGVPYNATIVSRQTDGVWGKFTISGLTSFSEFGGGEEATTWTVTSNSETGAGTLKQLISDATAGDIITFNGNMTIALTSPVVINKNLTIRGIDGGIILDAQGNSRVITTNPATNVRLEKLIIKNGDDTILENLVGGVLSQANLIMENCVVENNTCYGSLAVGGVLQYGEPGSEIALINCTITANEGDETDGTGGFSSAVGYEYIYNTIIYGNTGGSYSDVEEGISLYEVFNSCTGNLSGLTISDGGNNISGNPLFVTSSGSATHPYSIQSGSPCADAGNDSYCFETTDIKGDGRKLLKTDAGSTGTVDIGAYEYSSVNPLPVELTAFTATVNGNKITLQWQTATEVNNYGFSVERSVILSPDPVGAKNLLPQDWQNIGFVDGNGNSNSIKNYSFTDDLTRLADGQALKPNLTLVYRLKQIDTDGSYSYSNIVEVTCNMQPSTFELYQNYPNPFNPTTVISYQLPVISNVQLKIYDILGSEVATLVNEQKEPGVYEVEFNASQLSSGVYIYKLQIGEFTAVKKLMLMR